MADKKVEYDVHVTVECTCSMQVLASSEEEALAKAQAAYDAGNCDVDAPHTAYWRGAEVTKT